MRCDLTCTADAVHAGLCVTVPIIHTLNAARVPRVPRADGRPITTLITLITTDTLTIHAQI